MKSLRVKAWFKTIPRHVVLNAERCKKLGPDNLRKLLMAARKHKTAIHTITAPLIKSTSQSIAMQEKDYEEYKELIEAFGIEVLIKVSIKKESVR